MAITSKTFAVDNVKWKESGHDPTSTTMAEYMRFLADEIKKNIGAAEYVEVKKNSDLIPCVKLPWADGTIGKDYYPVIVPVYGTITTNTTLNTKCYLSTGMAQSDGTLLTGYSGYIYCKGGSGGSTSNPAALALLDYTLLLKLQKFSSTGEDFYGFCYLPFYGSVSADGYILGVTCFVGKAIHAVTKDRVNCMIHCQASASSQSNDEIRLYVKNGESISAYYKDCATYNNNAVIIIDKLNFGTFYSDIFHVVHTDGGTAVKGLTGYVKLQSHSSGFYENILLSDGIYYSLQIIYGAVFALCVPNLKF